MECVIRPPSEIPVITIECRLVRKDGTNSVTISENHLYKDIKSLVTMLEETVDEC